MKSNLRTYLKSNIPTDQGVVPRKPDFLFRLAATMAGVFGFGVCQASAANHYVRASSDVASNGDGSSWASAYKGFPAATAYVRGDTYYFAGGNYGKFTFNTANSGTSVITLKKATASDHGTSTGWVDSYGTTQAVFSLVSINKNYFVFDGSTGGGPGSWTTGFGVKIDTSSQTNTSAYPGVFLGELTQSTTSNITVKHFEVEGNHGDGTANNGGQTNDGVASWGSQNTTISYSYIHDMGRCICIFLSSSNVVFEYNYTGKYEYVAAEHSEIASTNGGPYTFRYNVFANCSGTGGLMFNGSGAEVYGNVFFHSINDKNWGYAANGLVGSKDSSEPVKNVKIYNNTFYRPFSDNNSGGSQIFGFYMGSDSVAKNNLYYGQMPPTAAFTQVTHDFNLYAGLTAAVAPAETNKVVITTNPFKNAEGLDFNLASNTSPGQDLGAPYNVDMFGNVRTTWTRGAIEFQNGGSQPVVVPPSGAVISISVP
jgi:Right handed beta helix region